MVTPKSFHEIGDLAYQVELFSTMDHHIIYIFLAFDDIETLVTEHK